MNLQFIRVVPVLFLGAAIVLCGFRIGEVFGSVSTAEPQAAKDSALAAVRRADLESKDSAGNLRQLAAAEHLRRANIYQSNRAFDEARDHWQALINFYPEHPAVAESLLGVARSYYQSRRYAEAYDAFDTVARRFPMTKEGREGLNFSGSALLRLGRPGDAVTKYIEYIQRFPNGERIDTAYLNVIDTMREAGRPQDALAWVTRTTSRFPGTAIATNARFGRLRLHVAEGDWKEAVATADELKTAAFSKDVLTTPGEVAYLRAYSLERDGRTNDSVNAYSAIPDGLGSYYGWLATERLSAMKNERARELAAQRSARVTQQLGAAASQYPAPYRTAIVRAAKARKIDPRFVLAIIKQESVFKPLAKSPAGARGLLQLTIDAAQRYAPGAGLNSLRESELYRPETSIIVGSEYLEHLQSLFPRMLEPVAASYNGGEDNVARWVKRAKQNDPGVFTSEVGFDETKGYVQKVMSNYRAYRQLYDVNLNRR
jgi:soluble lytic murein transglycosylase